MEFLLYDYLISLFSEYTYLFVFLMIFVLSIIPILTPPTWIVVVSAYSLNDQLNPFLLSVIGATAAVIGRLILLKVSTIGRKAMNEHRKNSLQKLRNYLEKTRYGYLFGTLLFALTPLPTNMLFISYGLMNATRNNSRILYRTFYSISRHDKFIQIFCRHIIKKIV